jgi:Protein of unknown function (DUF4058)
MLVVLDQHSQEGLPMKSPFPGMDPYLEAHGLWRDFHIDLIGEIKRALAAVLPQRYRLRSDERNLVELVETEGKTSTSFYPDVGVLSPQDRPSRTAETQATGPGTATAREAVSLRAFIAERFREQFIEITLNDPNRRLVTCIEVLSPTNKRQGSEGWKQYSRKRQALLLGEANLVEIDLLRGGQKMPMLDPWPDSPYSLLVARSEDAPTCRVWPGYLQYPLPVIPVPLEDPDPDMQLDLQPLIEAIYERNRYGEDIDYTKPLDLPLSPSDSAWLQEQLKARQRAS